MDVFIELGNWNAEKLDEEIRNALGDAVNGVSTSAAGVVVHLNERAKPGDDAVAKSVVRSHQPNRLTAAQQHLIDVVQRLQAARANSAGRSESKNPDLGNLAARIELLELELEALLLGL